MKIEVTDDRKNPLLNRREIRFRVVYEGSTPKLLDVRKTLISELKLNNELTILDSIKSEYGGQFASGYVKVYADKKSMTVEHENKIKKNLEPKEEKKKEEESEPAEEKTEEEPPKEKAEEEKPEPAEEKTEEKPKEKTEEEKPEPVEEKAEAGEEEK